MGVAGLAEGLLGGYMDSTGTAISLALEAKGLYSDAAGATAAWAEMSAATKANFIGKKLGEVLGIAASCTPAGRLGQASIKTCMAAGQILKSMANMTAATKKAYDVGNKAVKLEKSIAATKKTASVVEEAGALAKKGVEATKKLTERNFRKNLINATGGVNPGKSVHAHHIFPQ